MLLLEINFIRIFMLEMISKVILRNLELGTGNDVCKNEVSAAVRRHHFDCSSLRLRPQRDLITLCKYSKLSHSMFALFTATDSVSTNFIYDIYFKFIRPDYWNMLINSKTSKSYYNNFVENVNYKAKI